MSDQLRVVRDKLYHSFDKMRSPTSLFNLQLKIAEQILLSEKHITKNIDKNEWQFHLDRIYGIGDAIVWSIIDEFTIRQLSKFESRRTSLLSQKSDYLNLLKSKKDRAKSSILIFSDLTRCITIGDIIQVNSHDNVTIIECKESVPEILTATKILRGANGRQFSRTFWLTRYLHTGFEQLYSEGKPTKTIEIDIARKQNFHVLPSLIEGCLSNPTSFIQAEKGLVYLSSNLSKSIEQESLKAIKDLGLQNPIIAGTSRLLEFDSESSYHMTSLNFPIPLKYRIPIHEVDINIIGILDIDYIKDVAKRKGYIFNFNKDELPELQKNEKHHQFHIRFINDILINFLTVNSAIDVLIALFEKVEGTQLILTKDEENQMLNRPKKLHEFVDYLEDNYVTAKFNLDGDIIEAYRLNGERIV